MYINIDEFRHNYHNRLSAIPEEMHYTVLHDTLQWLLQVRSYRLVLDVPLFLFVKNYSDGAVHLSDKMHHKFMSNINSLKAITETEPQVELAGVNIDYYKALDALTARAKELLYLYKTDTSPQADSLEVAVSWYRHYVELAQQVEDTVVRKLQDYPDLYEVYTAETKAELEKILVIITELLSN